MDIGSTVVKLALFDEEGRIIEQRFHPRDHVAGITRQAGALLEEAGGYEGVAICSSANGGLRVGAICLSERFSAAEFRNQILLAGANPMFIHTFDRQRTSEAEHVDVLLVGGGIDCPEPGPLTHLLDQLDLSDYRYQALVYAGNRHLADSFLARFPSATVIRNPYATGIISAENVVFETLRRAYLDDLVHKEGISELQAQVGAPIRPTPEVVSLGFRLLTSNRLDMTIQGPSILIDIGGATTDLHFTTDLVQPDSPDSTSRSTSVARYVFTDLGIVASRENTSLQLKTHPRTFELISQCVAGDARDTYRRFREGEEEAASDVLAYACLFLAVERFAGGAAKGLPRGDLSRLSHVVLTGGASQQMSEVVVARLICMAADTTIAPKVTIDRKYEIWTNGITCTDPVIFEEK